MATDARGKVPSKQEGSGSVKALQNCALPLVLDDGAWADAALPEELRIHPMVWSDFWVRENHVNVSKQMDRHRSIRSFTGEGIAEEVLTRILEAAIRASTGGSMQLYSMIVTSDAARREVLCALHLGAEPMKQAAVVITFCVDTQRLSRWTSLQGEEPGFCNLWGFAMGFSDALLAAQNALLAAESEGLGGCFLGTTFVSAAALGRFFECPRGVVPVATLVIGHPAEEPERATRLPLAAITHRERYVDLSPEDLEAMYTDHAQTTLDRFCQTEYVGRAVRVGGIRNLAGYYTRLAYPGELIETAGAYFMAAIETQGFTSGAQLARIHALRRALESAEIAALHPIRQLVFAMSLVSGHADHLLALRPGDCETKISAFLTARDPAILDDLVQHGVFDTSVRARLYALLKELGTDPPA